MLKTLTFEGTVPSKLYEMTTALPQGNLILISSKVITKPIGPATNPPYESLSLRIGDLVNSSNVIDNDPNNFYFKIALRNRPEIDNTGAFTGRFVSEYENNKGITMPKQLDKQCSFSIYNNLGELLNPLLLDYFIFEFQWVGK